MAPHFHACSNSLNFTSYAVQLWLAVLPCSSTCSLVQEVVLQVGQLFLSPVATGGMPLLLKQASDDSSSSELLFSPLPGQERSQEAEAWQVQCHQDVTASACAALVALLRLVVG